MEPDRRDEDEIELGPDLTALERRLSAWRPSAGSLGRDRMLYESGRAAAGVRPWRMAAAALLVVSISLGFALVHDRATLARARALAMQEWAQRHQLEAELAARSAPTSLAPDPPEAIEPPAPSSYLALSARIAEGLDDLSPLDEGIGQAPPHPIPDPAKDDWHPSPLRPQDVRRVLDL